MIILIVLVNIDCFCWSSEFDPPFLPLVEEVFVAVWLKKLYFSSFRLVKVCFLIFTYFVFKLKKFLSMSG